MTRDGGRALRVAIFGESYLPYLSGVTVASEALGRGLAAAGHEVLMVMPRPAAGKSPGSAGAPGPQPRVTWLPSFQAPPPAPHAYRVPWPVPSAALREAAAFAPHVVHAQSPFTSGLMARRLARRLGSPLAFTHHTRFDDYSHYLGPLAGLASRATWAWLTAWWRGCAVVVAPGSQLADEIRARLAGTGPPVRVIPTGIDVAGIGALPRGDPRSAAGWPSDSLVVASLGRVAIEKSVDTLVDAFVRAAAAEPRLRLLLIGGGPAEGLVAERSAAAGMADRVRVTGMLPRLQALGLAAGADLFAFASRTETQGLVLAEALAAGLPTVAMDGPGVRDAVRSGVDGLVVDGLSEAARAAALGDAIGELAADPGRRAVMSAAARQGAHRFDLAIRIDEVVAVYREIVTRVASGA